jgi:hypothetical protein
MSTLLDHPRTEPLVAASDADSLVSLLARFAACEVNDLSVPELDEMIAVADRGVAWSQAMRVRACAQRTKLIAAGKPRPSSDDSRAEPRPKPLPKAGKSRREQERDEAAARAVGWAPSFGDALEAGSISIDHVAALGRVRHSKHVPAHETALLCVAKMRTAEDFVLYLRSWDAARDLDEGIDRGARQRRLRRVSFNRDTDGMGTMFAALGPLDATKVENTIRQIANELFRASADDGTTLTQRLADAFVLMAERASGRAGRAGGGDRTDNTSKSSRPTLVVVCDESSLRGRVEDAGLDYTVDGQPVPVSDLRRLACTADILPAVMSGAGQILDFGRGRRTATDVQRLALLAMYGGCIIDGCSCPAELIEIHHIPSYDKGGRTDLNAMAPICGPDHTRSHAEHWTFTRAPDGHLEIYARDGTPIPARRPRKPGKHGERPPAESPPDVATRAPLPATVPPVTSPTTLDG